MTDQEANELTEAVRAWSDISRKCGVTTEQATAALRELQAIRERQPRINVEVAAMRLQAATKQLDHMRSRMIRGDR